MKENRLPYHNKSGFQIPQNYLEDLELRLMSKLTLTEPETSPLEGLTKPFSTPENYFDNLEDRVMTNIQANKKESKVISLFPKKAFYYVAGVAAVLIAIFTNISVPQPDPHSLDNLDMVSLENYLQETMDYSNPDAPELISDEMFFASSALSSKIDQEALMEYLHENLEEPSMIFNEN